jgi:RNA polymerase subunit RPABC4/transcription elongation factor Spt4
MPTLWRIFASCMNCDRSVRPDATRCPHCGQSFESPKE